jgi:hypothetical protein
MSTPRRERLKVEIVDGRLVISIGVGTLAWAAENDHEGGFSKPKLRIRGPTGWAREVLSELLREDETGETPVGKLLDDAFLRAVEAGSQHATIIEEAE